MDEREALYVRRRAIEKLLPETAPKGHYPPQLPTLMKLRAELAAINGAIAQHDVANATREATRTASVQSDALYFGMHEAADKIAKAQQLAAAATDRATDAQAENTNAILGATKAREADRTATDDAAFWFRRYFTSVGVANAGAFAALGAGVLQSNTLLQAAAIALPGMRLFGIGAFFAGVIPAVLWLRSISSKARSRSFLFGVAVSLGIGSSFQFGTGMWLELSDFEAAIKLHQFTAPAGAPSASSRSAWASGTFRLGALSGTDGQSSPATKTPKLSPASPPTSAPNAGRTTHHAGRSERTSRTETAG